MQIPILRIWDGPGVLPLCQAPRWCFRCSRTAHACDGPHLRLQCLVLPLNSFIASSSLNVCNIKKKKIPKLWWMAYMFYLISHLLTSWLIPLITNGLFSRTRIVSLSYLDQIMRWTQFAFRPLILLSFLIPPFLTGPRYKPPQPSYSCLTSGINPHSGFPPTSPCALQSDEHRSLKEP